MKFNGFRIARKDNVMDQAQEVDPRRRNALKRVEELKGFYSHLSVYLVINLGLFLIDALTNRSNWWFYWPAIGWGTALAIHAAMTFGIEGPLGKTWEARKMRELMDRDNRHQLL